MKWFITNFECDYSKEVDPGDWEERTHEGGSLVHGSVLFLGFSHRSMNSNFLIDLLIVHTYFHLFFGGWVGVLHLTTYKNL